jgi:hypothetical protein
MGGLKKANRSEVPYLLERGTGRRTRLILFLGRMLARAETARHILSPETLCTSGYLNRLRRLILWQS